MGNSMSADYIQEEFSSNVRGYRMENFSRLFALAAVVMTLVATSARADLVLSTQPRGPYEKFGPPFEQVADYLTKATGEKVVYKHYRDWISYSRDIRKDQFDIVFDEAHFVSWRLANRKHILVAAAVPEASEKVVVIVKKDNNSVQHIGQVAGRTVCAIAPPNLSTLLMLNQFGNPVRVPLLVLVDNYDSAYRGISTGKCAAAVLSDVAFERLDKAAGIGKIIFLGERVVPGDAFTVSPRIKAETRSKILQALLDADTATDIKLFIDRYAFGKLLDLPVEEQYKGLDTLLKHDYGFGW